LLQKLTPIHFQCKAVYRDSSKPWAKTGNDFLTEMVWRHGFQTQLLFSFLNDKNKIPISLDYFTADPRLKQGDE
jgi:hypothetical protein